MIRYFSGQISTARRGDSGQALVLFAVTASAVLSILFAAIYVSHLGVAKVSAQNRVDAVALSAATWEARGLNLISSMNDGILQCLRAIRYTCVVWAALAVAACFGVGVPAFTAFSQRAPRIIRNYWTCARGLAAWSEKVRKATPYLVLAETAALSKELNLAGGLVPFNVRGEHDGKNTLELHVAPGPPVYLVDALSPLTKVLKKIGRWKITEKLARKIFAALDSGLRSIIGDAGEPIRMLVPEDDFPKRQNVRFAGFAKVSAPSIPYLRWKEESRLPGTAVAEPYGGTATEMTWKSRLTEGEPEK